MSRIKVENKVQVYEVNGTEPKLGNPVYLTVKSDGIFSARVLLEFDGKEIQVVGRDLQMAITNAIEMRIMNSFETSIMILDTAAPNTFLIPISFVRCSMDNITRPNSPIHEMKMNNPDAMLMICFHFASVS